MFDSVALLGLPEPLARKAALSLGATIRQAARSALAGTATHELRSAIKLLGLLVGVYPAAPPARPDSIAALH